MTESSLNGSVEHERRWLLGSLPSLEWDRSVACIDCYPASELRMQRYFAGDWRVDVFTGPLDGLITAQSVSADPSASLQPPFPVVREVTLDPLYSGSVLALRAAPPLEALRHGWLAGPQFDATRADLERLPSTVEHAAAWMLMLHRHQAARDDGLPYVSHPAEVSVRVAEWGGDDAQIVAALLHDSLEDQAERMAPGGDAAAVLEHHMGAEVRHLVQALTHGSGAEGYLAYIQALPARALDIKVADLSTNALRVEDVVSDARRTYLTHKYASTMCWLVERLEGHPALPAFQAAVDKTFGAVNHR